MRNIRDIYQKLRKMKYHYLIKLYKKYLKRIPSNCRYNFPYRFMAENNTSIEIRLCLLHQPNLDMNSGIFPNLVDVCQEPAHCINCNAFVLKYTKESIKKEFEEGLKSTENKAEKYPDICALEWVLEKPESATIPQPNWFYRIITKLKDM